MKNHVEILEKIPEDLFNDALDEVNYIDWEYDAQYDTRAETLDGSYLNSNNHVFSTSSTVHLRIHKKDKDTPNTILALSDIIECIDTKSRIFFPAINDLIDWIYAYVNGIRLGRIMIVNLKAHSNIDLHVDPGRYFENHYRFHVPFITNKNINFISTNKNKIHMPAGHLSQLNNRISHGVLNFSETDRVHMIVDIDSKDERFRI